MAEASLPQLDRLFVTDAGLETDFIFNRGIDLPLFASFTLLRDEAGRRALEDYFRSFLAVAHRLGTGCLLESASRRASPDWAPRLGLGLDELDSFNRNSVELLKALKELTKPLGLIAAVQLRMVKGGLRKRRMMMRHSLVLATAAMLAAGPATAQPAPPVQTVTMYSHGYTPRVLHLAAGRPVTLNFVNPSGKGHDFTARQFFRSARILSGRVADGEIDLRGKQSAQVTLVPARGRYPVHCGYPFHKMLGMRGTIIVH